MENIQASFTVAKINTYLTISPNLSKKKVFNCNKYCLTTSQILTMTKCLQQKI